MQNNFPYSASNCPGHRVYHNPTTKQSGCSLCGETWLYGSSEKEKDSVKDAQD